MLQRWLPTGEDDTVFSFDLMAGGRLDLRSPLRIARIRYREDPDLTDNFRSFSLRSLFGDKMSQTAVCVCS